LVLEAVHMQESDNLQKKKLWHMSPAEKANIAILYIINESSLSCSTDISLSAQAL
jgi:hypothetical protein